VAVVSGGQLLFQKCLVINEDLSYSKILDWTNESCLKADSRIACRAHAVPLPCRETKGLECVFPI
jgi:hypothetical protein